MLKFRGEYEDALNTANKCFGGFRRTVVLLMWDSSCYYNE